MDEGNTAISTPELLSKEPPVAVFDAAGRGVPWVNAKTARWPK